MAARCASAALVQLLQRLRYTVFLVLAAHLEDDLLLERFLLLLFFFAAILVLVLILLFIFIFIFILFLLIDLGLLLRRAIISVIVIYIVPLAVSLAGRLWRTDAGALQGSRSAAVDASGEAHGGDVAGGAAADAQALLEVLGELGDQQAALAAGARVPRHVARRLAARQQPLHARLAAAARPVFVCVCAARRVVLLQPLLLLDQLPLFLRLAALVDREPVAVDVQA